MLRFFRQKFEALKIPIRIGNDVLHLSLLKDIVDYNMPPNVLYSWDSIASKRQLHAVPVYVNDGDSEYSHQDPELDSDLFLSPQKLSKQPTPTEEDGRTLWKKILRNDFDERRNRHDEETSASGSSELRASLSSIIILNDEKREEDWLDRFGGRLSNVSLELLEGLR